MHQFKIVCGGIAMMMATGCAGTGSDPVRNEPAHGSQFKCADAIGRGIGAGPGTARVLAEGDAAQQVADIRGYLLNTGLRRIAPATKKITCKPFVLGGGMTQCLVIRRYCGR